MIEKITRAKLTRAALTINMVGLKTIKINLALMASVIFWSGSFVAIRIGLDGFSPSTLAGFRFAVAALCYVPLFWRSEPKQAVSWPNLAMIFVVGSVTITGYALLLNHGEQNISAGLASFIIAQTPVISALFAMIFLRERPSSSTTAGIAISSIGLLIIVMSQEQDYTLNFSILLVALAAAAGSAQSVMQKQLLRQLSPLTVSALSMWCATLSMVYFSADIIHDAANAPWQATMAVIYLGIFPSCLGSLLWNYGLSHMPVVQASVYLYAIPIISTFIGWFILGELPSAYELAGGLIAIAGAMMVKGRSVDKSAETSLDPAADPR